MSRLRPQEDQTVVRMYRHGHGDCFLLAFYRANEEPFYVLIDCGRKPGSHDYLDGTPSMDDIVDNIWEATGGTLNLFVLTHEHQDHVCSITKSRFDRFNIEKAWFAWTEHPTDPLAKELRRRHKDTLVALTHVHQNLQAVGEHDVRKELEFFLGLELGDTSDLSFAASDPRNSTNKKAMKLVKEKAREREGIEYLNPGEVRFLFGGAQAPRVAVLGPPRSQQLLSDEDPKGSEEFHISQRRGLSLVGAVDPSQETLQPFDGKYVACKLPLDQQTGPLDFLHEHYGTGQSDKKLSAKECDGTEIGANEEWRRIDTEWLAASTDLALKLNRGINNTSLVLAIRLPKTGKVLFFPGDAQRGSWVSWSDHTFDFGSQTYTTKELMADSVLYKVGHHGSHNATLDGKEQDVYPNLSWFAQGDRASEFTAMIPAVNAWALSVPNPPWVHPLPAIKRALEEKTGGKVLQLDTGVPEKPEAVEQEIWDDFLSRTEQHELYVDLRIEDQ